MRKGHHRLTKTEEWYFYGKYANRLAVQGRDDLVSFAVWQLAMEELAGPSGEGANPDFKWWAIGRDA